MTVVDDLSRGRRDQVNAAATFVELDITSDALAAAMADAKPEVMLVSITAALDNMAQQYKQLGLTFTVAGTTFFQDPDVIKDPASEGFVHTQIRIEAPPELAAADRTFYEARSEARSARASAVRWTSSSAMAS